MVGIGVGIGVGTGDEFFNSGDRIMLPSTEDYFEDTFIITNVRPWFDGFILDAFCDGDETINISINSKEVVKING